MSENRNVNALMESLDNATGETRTPERVSQLLGRCQGNACGCWDQGCQRYDREAWVRVMITPGRKCDRGPGV